MDTGQELATAGADPHRHTDAERREAAGAAGRRRPNAERDSGDGQKLTSDCL
jgi:hypothetical protein